MTDGELSSFMQSIWDADVNAATDVRVSLQSHTSTSSQSDRASHRYGHHGIFMLASVQLRRFPKNNTTVMADTHIYI